MRHFKEILKSCGCFHKDGDRNIKQKISQNIFATLKISTVLKTWNRKKCTSNTWN